MKLRDINKDYYKSNGSKEPEPIAPTLSVQILSDRPFGWFDELLRQVSAIDVSRGDSVIVKKTRKRNKK
jgi:hypothetical protein